MQIITIAKSVALGLLFGLLITILPGCQKQEGPAERAGKQLDQAAEKVGQQIEKAGDSVQDAAKGNKK